MTAELVPVRIIGLPIAVHRLAAEHVDGLQREFDLLTRSDQPAGSVPQRLLDLISEIQDEFGGIGDHPAAELQQAMDDGQETVDLEYAVPPAVAEASRRLGELLDEADRYCLTGDHLVMLATPAEARRYRQWFLGEFIEQVAGRAPVPWSAFDVSPGPLGPSVPDDVRSYDAPREVGDDGSAVVALEGELDLTNAGTVREALRSVRPGPEGRVEVDLTAVTFVDSAALSVLVAAHTRFEGDGVTMQLIVPPRIMRTMQLACLDEVLHLDASPG